MVEGRNAGEVVAMPSTAASGSAVPEKRPTRLSVDSRERKMVEFIVDDAGGSTATPSREKIDPDAEVATKLKSELMEEAFIRLITDPAARELLLNTIPKTVAPLPVAILTRTMPSRQINAVAVTAKEEAR